MNDLAARDEDIEYVIDEGAVHRHLTSLYSGDSDDAYSSYTEDAVLAFPQSGETVRGRDNIKAARRRYSGRKLVKIDLAAGQGDLWLAECIFAEGDRTLMVVTLMEFCEGQIVREREYTCGLLPAA